MTPVITVLMPVHNGALFLRDSVGSILAQTFKAFELLIVDDLSTDNSLAIAESFKDPRVKVIRSEARRGFSGALNVGMDNAAGEYLARMDADDIALPTRFSRQLEFMRAHPRVGLCGSWVETFGDHPSSGRVLAFPLTQACIRAQALFDNPFAHPSVMLCRRLFEASGLRFDGSYCPAEDYELWTRALERMESANLPAVLLRYRLHAAGMTLGGKPEMDRQSLRILARLFGSIGLSPSPEELVFHRLIGTARVPEGWQVSGLASCHDWLLRIREASVRTAQYDPQAIDKAIQRVWFDVCYRTLPFGWCAVTSFSSSRFAGDGPDRLKRTMLMAAAYIKRRLLKGRS